MPLNGTFGNASAKASGNAGNLDIKNGGIKALLTSDTALEDQLYVTNDAIYLYGYVGPSASAITYVTKLSKYGHVVYRKQFDGGYSGKLRGGPNTLFLHNTSDNRMTVVKTSQDYGSIQWQKKSNSSASISAFMIEDSASQYLYIAGGSNGNISQHSLTDGSFIAANIITLTGYSVRILGLTTDNYQNIYAYGDISTGGSTLYQYIIAFDTNFNILWQKQNTSIIGSIDQACIDLYDNVFLRSTGSGVGQIIHLYDVAGDAQWSYKVNSSLGTLGSSNVQDVFADTSGNYYYSTRLASDSTMVYLVKVNSIGNISWQKKITGINSTTGFYVQNNDIYMYSQPSGVNGKIIIQIENRTLASSKTYNLGSGVSIVVSDTTEISHTATSGAVTTNSTATFELGDNYLAAGDGNKVLSSSTAVSVTLYQ